MRNIFENTNTNIAGECFVVNESYEIGIHNKTIEKKS